MSDTVAGEVARVETAHAFERVRDVPASCACLWWWSPTGARYARVMGDPECPWHLTDPWSAERQRSYR